jgi:hypothetical protein
MVLRKHNTLIGLTGTAAAVLALGGCSLTGHPTQSSDQHIQTIEKKPTTYEAYGPEDQLKARRAIAARSVCTLVAIQAVARYPYELDVTVRTRLKASADGVVVKNTHDDAVLRDPLYALPSVETGQGLHQLGLRSAVFQPDIPDNGTASFRFTPPTLQFGSVIEINVEGDTQAFTPGDVAPSFVHAIMNCGEIVRTSASDGQADAWQIDYVRAAMADRINES